MLVCEECGSTNIQIKIWVDANTDAYDSEGDEDVSDRWCSDCNQHVNFITKENYENTR